MNKTTTRKLPEISELKIYQINNGRTEMDSDIQLPVAQPTLKCTKVKKKIVRHILHRKSVDFVKYYCIHIYMLLKAVFGK